jgi:uncharacterized protein (TIGR02611 family)
VKALTKQILRWAKICLGFALLIIGFIGGFIPILQGWMFVLPGLAILATEFTWAKRVDDWVRAKFKNAIAKFKQNRAGKKETDGAG